MGSGFCPILSGHERRDGAWTSTRYACPGRERMGMRKKEYPDLRKVLLSAFCGYNFEPCDSTTGDSFIFNGDIILIAVFCHIHRYIINNEECVFVIVEGDTKSVIWKDDSYSYLIQGQFKTKEEILKIASSIKIINN